MGISFCKFGWHRPLRNHVFYFTDHVGNKPVYLAECSCGQKYMVNSKHGFGGFKARKSDKPPETPPESLGGHGV